MRKTFAGFLVFGLLATFSVTPAATKLVSAEEGRSPRASVVNRDLSLDDFNDEVEADSRELGVSIAQSTITSTSQSLTVRFNSKTLSGFRTAIGNFIVAIDDPNYTGDKDNPAPEGYEIFDEETGLPLFNGYVAYVTGGTSSRNKKVYIPSTLTLVNKFTISVTKIAASAVTSSGYHQGDFDIDSCWIDPTSSDLRIEHIYIPDTIEKVEANAFTGIPTDGSVMIHYEGNSLPSSVFESGWVDTSTDNTDVFDISASSYDTPKNKSANVGASVDLPDELGRPLNFMLGYIDEAEGKNYPLTIQYDLLKGSERTTIFEELPLVNTVGNKYDSCGSISSLSYTRTIGYKLGPGESIDDESIVFHNILMASASGQPDFSQRYFAKPLIGYSHKQDINNLVHVRPTTNSVFAGFSMFTMRMDKNLSIRSEKYPQPHSLYLDVKTDIYEQNAASIKSGKTKIRYSLYNLYNSFYHIQYVGKNNQLKDVTIPVNATISYQTLDKDKNNLVSVLLKDSQIGPDFKLNKVRLFELQNITIQMDLLTTSDSGSVSILGKSAISYKFAFITIIDTRSDIKIFNWNLFLIFFFVGYIAVYAAAAFGVYKFMKEKFKNDEFRRVNDKKFLRQAIIGGLGLGEVLLAVLFLIMRTAGFKNTIIVYNPTDPILIATAIVALIIIGYFIVYLVKLIKAEKDRRKAIRLKLNEDVEDDGTN